MLLSNGRKFHQKQPKTQKTPFGSVGVRNKNALRPQNDRGELRNGGKNDNNNNNM